MPDYKAMYYHLAGRMATAVEVLEATTNMLNSTAGALKSTAGEMAELTEKLKLAQQSTEEMFISCDEDDSDSDPKETI